MLADTKPSKVAARLSLADWLLVESSSSRQAASVSSSTVAAITDATVHVALVRALIIGDMVARSMLWFELEDNSLTATSMSSAVNGSAMTAPVREH